MWLNLVMAIVPAAVIFALWKRGLWSNTLTMVNVITAALVATNYYEPVARFLTAQMESATFLWDFVSLWLLFIATLLVFSFITDYMSQVKVHFPTPVDKAGSVLMTIWVAWIALCFTTMTLHTAPLARHFLGDFQPEPDTHMFFGTAPDRIWLAWVHRESRGTLSRFGGTVPFDARGDFIMRYSNRRGEFEDQKTFLKGSGSGASGLPGG